MMAITAQLETPIYSALHKKFAASMTASIRWSAVWEEFRPFQCIAKLNCLHCKLHCSSIDRKSGRLFEQFNLQSY
jgi:hypothetical protein